MNFIEKEQTENENYKIIDYKLNETIRRSNIVDIVKLFESDTIKMGDCYISSYSDNGSVLDLMVYNVEDLEQIKGFPNPSISFTLNYVDRFSNEYKFTIKTETNNKKIRYLIDKKKQQLDQMKDNGRSRH